MNMKKKPAVKFCDPAICDECVYIGEGAFICEQEKKPVIVVSDFAPTADYQKCMEGKRHG